MRPRVPWSSSATSTGCTAATWSCSGRAQALEPGAPLVVVTFWPHPMSVIRPDQTPLLLGPLERRVELLRGYGAADVVVVEFTPEVAGWSPARFVDEVLRPLHPVRVVVGENFRFGFRAAGHRRHPRRARRGPSTSFGAFDAACRC